MNRVFGGGANTGYRLGLLDGKPCFEVPLTDWSHHLTASKPLPLGRWVHLAGTFDGQDHAHLRGRRGVRHRWSGPAP